MFAFLKFKENELIRNKFFWLIDDYQQKKERKTFAIMCKAHWCSFPPFYGWYINQLDKILDSFLNLRIKNSTDSKYLYIVFVFIWFCMIVLFWQLIQKIAISYYLNKS